MTYEQNPFRDCSLEELAEAYMLFYDQQDHEAMDWIKEVWVHKLKLNITFAN